MHDPRIDTLANVLLDHSCELKKGETILIEAIDLPEPDLVVALVEGAAKRGATPLVELKNQRIQRAVYANATEEGMKLAGGLERARMEKVQAYIGVRGAANASALKGIPAERMDLYQEHWLRHVNDYRVPKTKWVVLRYPTDSFAQAADMPTHEFTDFFFDVCTADYAAMGEAQKPLVARMQAADRIKITAPGTDLEFSIKDIPVIPCSGERNIPDGEVFTAPVRDSINGVIRFNTPSRYQGIVFTDITFTFKDGKIVEATSSDTERINQLLDSDEGARYCGEWAIGTNNRVRHPMLDTLFDEKIGGSFHLTPGNAYDEADNGNRSRIHWDLVLIQRADYGGGEMYFDGELVRKDGFFVPDDLQGLNEGL
ncbi:Aminopeptidase PepS [Botrimarina colliarenosi]|uniref:Aminopeptidase PepS n=1 Tax=Botrimarina colliarenosi TaxID=2528001 RepID=A0A5C6AID2_9BACT|nr:aminopeptidase [Botrimarina colliarenosi]TWT99812.1 Aminopeptidase PepS [Botrimarina colliarenosi]